MTFERFLVGVTDSNWYSFLRSRAPLDEVNFWTPSGRIADAERNTPFLFKLKSPYNAIGGGGFIAFSQRMPIRDAWEFFKEKNGASSLEELRQRIGSNRRGVSTSTNHVIGCIVLSEPFFFADPIPQPEDWSGSIQNWKRYYLSEANGQRVWRSVALGMEAASAGPASAFGGFGAAGLRVSRLGQGAFRKLVLDAYARRCAVTGEHTVPVIEASHIKPFADVACHEVTNGLALRSDIHILFDRGYVTVTPDYRFLVSERLREDFDNGRIYYEYAKGGSKIFLPSDPSKLPNREHLEWHRSECYEKFQE